VRPVEAAPHNQTSCNRVVDSGDPGRKKGVVAYFGPDAEDPAVGRRIIQWTHAGFEVLPFAFVRGSSTINRRFQFTNLGPLMPQSLILRLAPMALAALRLLRFRPELAAVQIFVGRNLDNALLGVLGRYISGSSGALVYEVLDVNRRCTEPGVRAAVLRRIERWLLDRVDHLVVSSPYFVTNYFQAMLGYRGSWSVFENKVARFAHERQPDLAPVPVAPAVARPWRIGWFGYLDDEGSWDVLRRVAESLPREVVIQVRGIPYMDFDMDRFRADVERLDNVVYDGAYRNPEDLAEIYGAVDLVWSMDCNSPSGNSKWLLTNALYEAGYFGKPVLGMAGTAVGEFIARHGTGWCLQEPLAETLIDLIRHLSRVAYTAKSREILRMRSRLFIEGDEIERIWSGLPARGLPQVAGDNAKIDDATHSAIENTAPDGNKLLCLGFFPPPVDGQRIITQAVFERFAKLAVVQRGDFDGPRWLGPLSKLVGAVRACFAMLSARMKGFSALYLAPHSGSGLLFSCFVATFARCLGYSLAIHYHSYRNIGRYSRLMASFVAICGSKAIHIVLAPPMERDLRHLYPAIARVVVVSNCGLIEPRAEFRRQFDARRVRLGHLSNLSHEKGIDLVFECMRALRARDIEVELWLAGPAEGEGTAALIHSARSEFGDRVTYLGRLDATAVRRFYQEIDVFLFPSVHRHEAEPLVVIDAIAQGVPVIAADRGCIGYLLDTAGSYVFPIEAFVERAVEKIAGWVQAPLSLAEASRRARGRFLELHAESQAHFRGLIPMILGTERRHMRADTSIGGTRPGQPE
jgi:succinoglycan biosynthesis protein ExoL